jgi:hypothetical protein
MAEVIKEFLVELGFKVDKTSQNRFNTNIKNVGKALAGLGLVVATKRMVGFIESVASGLDATQQLSTRVNATAKEISELGFAASVSGSSIEAVNRSFEGLNRAAGEAANGVGRGAEAFRQLGIQARKQDGSLKKTSELMQDIGDQIKDLNKQQQIAVLAKIGIDPTLVNVLTSDVRGLKKEFDDLYSSVGVNVNKAAKSSEKFNDSLTRLGTVFDAIKKAVALRFIPEITQGMDKLRKNLIHDAPQIIDSLAPIVEAFLRITSGVITLVDHVSRGFRKLNKATNGWAGTIIAAAAAWRLLNVAFLASPIGIILSLVAAVGLLVDDFIVWEKGGQSLIQWGKDFNAVLKFVTDTIHGFEDAITSALRKAGSLVPSLHTFAKLGANLGSAAASSFTLGGSASLLSPFPPDITAGNTANNTLNQNTNITVNGSDSPQSTASAVGSEASRVNADLARNLPGQFK